MLLSEPGSTPAVEMLSHNVSSPHNADMDWTRPADHRANHHRKKKMAQAASIRGRGEVAAGCSSSARSREVARVADAAAAVLLRVSVPQQEVCGEHLSNLTTASAVEAVSAEKGEARTADIL